MRFIAPLLSLLLSTAGLAESTTWETLVKIGDTLKIDRGEIALVTSLSEPIYLVIAQPNRTGKGLRLRPPESPSCYYSRSLSRDYVNRRTQVASWNRPFPISGPCTIRLGTSAVMTVRIISPNQG